jgi:hypothetical protein
MDEIVKQALAKWPNVPHCHGWLGLDARGNWYLRDAHAQSLGDFASGPPGARGSQLRHDKLIAFIERNYAADEAGQWFFQNGPQRVYVELECTPWVWRLSADGSVRAHSGASARVQRCLLDELGRVYLETDLGFGLVHTQDVGLAAEAVEQGLWVPQEMPAASLPARFGYVRSPQARREQALATP